MDTLSLDGNLNLPVSGTTAGVIFRGGQTFIHSFGIDNTFVGSGAGNLSMTGNNNAAVGSGALFNVTTGVFNTAVGSGVLTSSTTGNDNVAVGFEAMNGSVNASSNLAIGTQALFNNVAGSTNIAIGLQAGGLITGSYNIDIGNPGVASESNTMRLGDVQTSTFIAGTAVRRPESTTPSRSSSTATASLGLSAPRAASRRISTTWETRRTRCSGSDR